MPQSQAREAGKLSSSPFICSSFPNRCPIPKQSSHSPHMIPAFAAVNSCFVPRFLPSRIGFAWIFRTIGISVASSKRTRSRDSCRALAPFRAFLGVSFLRIVDSFHLVSGFRWLFPCSCPNHSLSYLIHVEIHSAGASFYQFLPSRSNLCRVSSRRLINFKPSRQLVEPFIHTQLFKCMLYSSCTLSIL